jgi:hypothetical protein
MVPIEFHTPVFRDSCGYLSSNSLAETPLNTLNHVSRACRRLHRSKEMYVIWHDFKGKYLPMSLLRDPFKNCEQAFPDLPLKDASSILRYPDYMIVKEVHRVS